MLTSQLHRERLAWRRRIRLACGCTLPCRCDWRDRPTEHRAQAYAQAVAALDELGYPAAPLLPELAVLVRQGAAERRMVEAVLRRWAA